jgi:ACS family tartrate transporter-like MFS transporter
MNPLYLKISRRLVPFLMLLYLVSFLNRVNVSFAALTMNRDLKIGEGLFGLAAGMFFLGYFIFEVPGNIMLLRMGARRWIMILMVAGASCRWPMPSFRGLRSISCCASCWVRRRRLFIPA